MTGILFFIFLGIWIFLVYKISIFATLKFKSASVKRTVQIFVFIITFFAPVSDEIIGGIQFKILCADTYLIVDKEKAEGKTVVSQKHQEEALKGFILTTTENRFSYKDIESNEVPISWNVYRSKGGVLSQSLNFFGSTNPLLFNNVCISPDWKKTIFSDLNVKVISK